MTFHRATIAACTTIALVVLSWALAYRGTIEHQSFKAFYCAGAALNEGADPYLVEPLRSCEHRLAPNLPRNVVEPAPLPAYALLPFALLARLPPQLASELFAVLTMLAGAATAFCVSRMSGVPFVAVVFAFLPLTLLNIAYGEVAPFATLALASAAVALGGKRWVLAGVAVVAAAVQPNVALPAVAAVFIAVSQTRRAILSTLALLTFASTVAIGWNANVEYLTKVLPLQAISELVAADQYGSSHMLYVFGLPEALALRFSGILFALSEGIVVVLSVVLARRDGKNDLLPLLPAAAAALFGVFLHDIQMIFALPAAFVVAARSERRTVRVLAAVALLLLVCVWDQRSRAAVLFDVVAVAAVLLAVVSGPWWRRIAAGALGAIVIGFAVIFVQHALPSGSAGIAQSIRASGDELSPIAWARYLRASPQLMRPEYLSKIPTWISLLALLAAIGLLPKRLAAKINEPFRLLRGARVD